MIKTYTILFLMVIPQEDKQTAPANIEYICKNLDTIGKKYPAFTILKEYCKILGY